VHQELDALQVVTTPSQVIDVPVTLEHVVATQLKVELEQLVVHIVVACAEGAIPVDAASATTARRPVRIKSLLIVVVSFSEKTQLRSIRTNCLTLSCALTSCRGERVAVVKAGLRSTMDTRSHNRRSPGYSRKIHPPRHIGVWQPPCRWTSS
jgi:hypothetical protein